MELGKECRQAGLAQLEERGSHNPEVVSSSLTTRIIISFFNLVVQWEYQDSGNRGEWNLADNHSFE